MKLMTFLIAITAVCLVCMLWLFLILQAQT